MPTDSRTVQFSIDPAGSFQGGTMDRPGTKGDGMKVVYRNASFLRVNLRETATGAGDHLPLPSPLADLRKPRPLFIVGEMRFARRKKFFRLWHRCANKKQPSPPVQSSALIKCPFYTTIINSRLPTISSSAGYTSNVTILPKNRTVQAREHFFIEFLVTSM